MKTPTHRRLQGHWESSWHSHNTSMTSRVFPVCYLQDVVQQGDSGLVGFRFCQFEQSADLKTFSVPRVSPLTWWHHTMTDDTTKQQVTSHQITSDTLTVNNWQVIEQIKIYLSTLCNTINRNICFYHLFLTNGPDKYSHIVEKVSNTQDEFTEAGQTSALPHTWTHNTTHCIINCNIK